MPAKILRTIRERLRPLHRARQNKLLARYVLPVLDRPVTVRLRDVAWPVRVRLIRHLTYILDSRIVEPGEIALFAVLCRRYRPHVLWDVGANIGLYSWLAISADSATRAVLFEPDPDNLALLSRTIADAGIRRATILPCAVSDRAGEAVFQRDTVSGHTGGIAHEKPRDRQDRILVRTVTLDGMMQTEPSPDLVKIDVEGGEAAVFAGAQRLIATVQPILLFESFNSSLASILAELNAAGYVTIGAEDPDGPMAHASNFLALPARHAAEIQDVREAWRSELAMRGLGRKIHAVRNAAASSTRS